MMNREDVKDMKVTSVSLTQESASRLKKLEAITGLSRDRVVEGLIMLGLLEKGVHIEAFESGILNRYLDFVDKLGFHSVNLNYYFYLKVALKLRRAVDEGIITRDDVILRFAENKLRVLPVMIPYVVRNNEDLAKAEEIVVAELLREFPELKSLIK